MKTQEAEGTNLLTTLYRSVFARTDKALARQHDYFTPRLVEADRQLQALAKRLRATYERGALDWAELVQPKPHAQPHAPGASDATEAPDAIWGRGPRVIKKMHGQEIEITVGAQLLNIRDPGEATSQWLVLTPGVSVKPAAPPPTASISATSPAQASRPFDASWSADEENATGADRLRLLRDRGPASAAARDTIPPAIASARARLIEKAAQITCDHHRVFAIAQPLPRRPEDPRDLGQANFDIEALTDLIERTRAFAHALTKG